VTKKSEEEKKLKLVNKSTSFSDLIEHLSPTFNIFFATTLWLSGKISSEKKVFENFLVNIVDLVVDFDENYNFETNNEMQSMHWHNYQITILVHICWMQKLNIDLHDPNSCILMKYHFYSLNEKTHDNYFV
jgi:hypothetical protein